MGASYQHIQRGRCRGNRGSLKLRRRAAGEEGSGKESKEAVEREKS